MILRCATPTQIPTCTRIVLPSSYTKIKNEKKRTYVPRVIKVEQGTFTTLFLAPRMEWVKNLSDTIAVKKGEMYSTTISFVRITEGTILCLRGSRANRRRTTNIRQTDFEIEKGMASLA